MSEAIESAVQHRAGKKDWRARIAGASIPEPAKNLIESVVRRTRLWRSEKAAVASELIAHFADAADAGVVPEIAVQRFGDPRQAARLIRRAKIRNRSYLWHAMRWLKRAVLAIVVFYTGVGIYFYAGRPNPSVDYVAVLNARLPDADRSQHAWPIYRAALLSIPAVNDIPEDHPDEPGWANTRDWLLKHSELVEQLRVGAACPVMGLGYATEYDAENERLLGPLKAQTAQNGWRGTTALAIPPLNRFRMIANILARDADLAAEQRDGLRLQRNLIAIHQLAEQLCKRDFLVTDLVAIGIRSVAYRQAAGALQATPELLDEAFLVAYTHRLSVPQSAADLVTLAGERLLFLELLQNVYTDDGNGDGRITPQLEQMFGNLATVNEKGEPIAHPGVGQKTLEMLVAPAAMMVVASRKDMLEHYDAQLAIIERTLSRPYRESRQEIEAATQKQIEGLSLKYAFAGIVWPSIARIPETGERALASRDGVIVAIGLELYRRSNGRYPDTLEALSPRYLPTIPADRIDGQEVRYELIDGKPVIYSVGVDRDDDGGRMPTRNGEPRNHDAIGWASSTKNIDGDWILYPPQ